MGMIVYIWCMYIICDYTNILHIVEFLMPPFQRLYGEGELFWTPRASDNPVSLVHPIRRK